MAGIRYYDTSSTVTAIDAATTINALNSALTTMGTAYGLTIKFWNTTPAAPYGGDLFTDADIVRARQGAKIFIEELAKYETSFVLASDITDVSLVKDNLTFNGTGSYYAYAWDYQLWTVTPADLNTQAAAENYARVFHHEYFHIIDASWPTYPADGGIDYTAWDASNPAGFVYGQPWTETVDGHLKGFIDSYATTNHTEDSAQIHSAKMAPPRYQDFKNWLAGSDQALKDKNRLHQEFLGRHSSIMGSATYYDGINGMAVIGSLVEDFATGLDGNKWPALGGITVSNGVGTQACEAMAYNTMASAHAYTLNESSVHVKATPTPNSAGTAVFTAMSVASSTDGTDITITHDAPTGMLKFSVRVDYGDAGETTLAYSATDHAWWRIREAGGSVYFETSPDGSSWVTRRTASSPAWVADTDLCLVLMTNATTITAGGNAVWDNVNVSGQAPTVPPFTGKAATWADNFEAASTNPTATHNAYQTGLDGTKHNYPYSAATNGYNRVNAPAPFVRVQGGNLEIDCQRSCGNSVSPAYRLDLVDSQIAIQIAAMPNDTRGFTGSPFVRFGFATSGTDCHSANSFAFKFLWIGSTGTLEVKSGADATVDTTTLGTNVEPKWMRVRHSATGGNGTLYFDYATVTTPASGDWTTVHSMAPPASVADVYFEMFSENGNGGPTGSTDFGDKHNVPVKIAAINTTASAPPPTGGTLISTLVEDFADALSGTVWAIQQNITVTGSTGRLACETAVYNTLGSVKSYTLAGSAVYAKVTPTPASADTGVHSEMRVAGATSGTNLAISHDPAANQIYFASNVDYWESGRTALTYNAVDHAWWRIREAGGTVYWETSADGTSWTVRRSLATPAWVTGNTALGLEFVTNRATGSTTNYMTVDSINTGGTVEDPTANATANFTTGSACTPLMFAGSCSTYGPNNIYSSADTRTKITALKLDMMRIPIQWNGGSPISGADSGPTGITAMQWIDTIIGMGIIPVVICVGPGGSNNTYTSEDCASLVTYFGSKVNHYIIGNEPADPTGTTSITRINNAAIAMKAARSGILTYAPGFAGNHWSETDLNNFLDGADDVDGWDYHNYPMGEHEVTTAEAFTRAETFRAQVALSKARMAFYGKTAVPPIVGETNWSWDYDNSGETTGGDQRFFGPETTVLMATIFGNVVTNGGRVHHYADINGPLGLLAEQDHADSNGKAAGTIQPGYYGVAAWTGAGIWPKAAPTKYPTSSALSNVGVYAVDNVDGGRNIIIVNTSTTTDRTVSLALTGASSLANYKVYKTNRSAPYSAPTEIQSGVHSGTITTSVPYMSYAVVVLAPGTAPVDPDPVPVPGTPAAPGVVRSLTPASTGTTATGTWLPPTTAGSAAISAYVLSLTATGQPTVSLVKPNDTNNLTASRTHTFTGLVAGVTYTLSVSARNVVGDSTAVTTPVTTTAPPTTVPTAPTALIVTPGNVSLSLSWTAPTSNGGAAIDRYDVTYTPAGGSPTATTTTVPSIALSGLTNDVAVALSITAHNSVGSSPALTGTGTPTAPPATTVPSAPVSVSATPGNAQVVATWVPPTNNGGSAILDYEVVISGVTTETKTVTGTTATFTNLFNGSAYTVTVRARNAIGFSPTVVSGAVRPFVLPGSPTGLATSSGDRTIRATWTAPVQTGTGGITHYVGTVALPSGDIVATINTVDSTTRTLDFPNLTNGVTYTVAVAAVTTYGQGPAATSTATPVPVVTAAPTVPRNFVAAPGVSGAVNLTWAIPDSDGNSPITGYGLRVVNVALDTLFSETMLAPFALFTTVSGLTNGSEYRFTLTAVNLVGTSTGVVATETPVAPATPPGEVVDLVGVATGETTILLSWGAPITGSTIAGYEVDYGPTTPNIMLGPAVLSHTLTGLTADTEYTIVVRAINLYGSSTGQTVVITTNPVYVPPPLVYPTPNIYAFPQPTGLQTPRVFRPQNFGKTMEEVPEGE